VALPLSPSPNQGSQGQGSPEGAPERALEQRQLELLLEAVYRRYGFDFRQYAQASLKRRLYRRLLAEGLDTISQLQSRLLHDPTVRMKDLDDDRVHARMALVRDLFGLTAREDEPLASLHVLPGTRARGARRA